MLGWWLVLLGSVGPAVSVVVRVDPTARPALPADAEHLAGPYYRVTGVAAPALRRRGLERVWPEGRRRIVLDQLEPFEPLQWHLANDGARTDLWPELRAGADIGAAAAWAYGDGDPAVVVAVLDGGIPSDHPDLPAAARVPGWDFVDGDDDPAPLGGDTLAAHGTAVAALALAARNGQGVVGVCPRCSLLAVRVLAEDSTARDGDLVAAIAWAAERADVLIASWSFDPYAYVSPAVHDALGFAASAGRGGRGAVVVFSAGNRGRAIDAYAPQAMVETLSVGATDERDLRASYSNTGPFLSLMAPGGLADQWRDGARLPRAKLVTADLVGEAGNSPQRDALLAPGIVDDAAVTASFYGTSAAAPLVGGAAALLVAARPELTRLEIAWLLTETARPVGEQGYDAEGRNDAYGHGRLDVGAALAALAAGTTCVAQAELCANGLDDDCDRATDGLDPDCGAARPRAFTVPLGAPCLESVDCGDGLCAAADGAEAVRLCAALCDYDCPADGVCVGVDAQALCRPSCAAGEPCPAGTRCATPEIGLVPPGLPPAPACLPRCATDDDCVAARCLDQACAGARLDEPPSAATPHGCDCTAGAPAGAWAALLVAVRRRRRAGRPTRPVCPPAGR